MKKTFFAIALLITIGSFAQKNTPPPVAKAAFAKAYPGAIKVKWEKENGEYEVTFEQKGQEMSAIYDTKGVFQEAELEMKVSDLPTAITNYMKAHYKAAVKSAAKITKADGTVNYEAVLKGKDVMFDANGKFIKEVVEKEDKD
jgi:hypothetical protein